MGRSRLVRRVGSSPQVSEAGWETVQPPDGPALGLWQVMWNEGDTLRTLPFRTAPEVRAQIQKMVRLPAVLCPTWLATSSILRRADAGGQLSLCTASMLLVDTAAVIMLLFLAAASTLPLLHVRSRF